MADPGADDDAEFDRLATAAAEELRAAGASVTRSPARLAVVRDWAFGDTGMSGVANVRVTAERDPTAPGWRVAEIAERTVMHAGTWRTDEEWRRATAAEAIALLRERLAIDPFGVS